MMSANRKFVGFGFGAIQSGLFIAEAFASKNFSRLAVAEVDGSLVQAVRGNGGACTINVALCDRIQPLRIDGIELYDPREADDRKELIEAITVADELATALPSVSFYGGADSTVPPEPATVVSLLAEGLSRRRDIRPAVVYAAENHNRAAEILEERVRACAAPGALENVQFVNTVIGKMSGVVTDPAEIARLGLATLTPASSRAVLVEQFNRILISRVHLEAFVRGLDVFIEKDDLLPFEEAKLFGHNAVHALMGYLAWQRGLKVMSELSGHSDILRCASQAFLHESGAALIRKYGQLNEPLFSPQGFQEYADDLIRRMLNPYLHDAVARVIREPARKLAYDDRFFGAMRLALSQGISPTSLACGAAAALRCLAQFCDARIQSQDDVRQALSCVWRDAADAHVPTLVQLVWQANAQHGPD